MTLFHAVRQEFKNYTSKKPLTGEIWGFHSNKFQDGRLSSVTYYCIVTVDTGSSEILVSIYQTKWCYIPEDSHLAPSIGSKVSYGGHTRRHTHTHTQTCTHADTRTRARAHTHTHTHTHTQRQHDITCPYSENRLDIRYFIYCSIVTKLNLVYTFKGTMWGET
jgi:hypothetical protein